MDKRVPLGMLYLGGSLKRAGYAVKAYHMMEGEIDEYLNKIEIDNVLFVAVTSIMTGYSLRGAMTFSKKLRAKDHQVPILWGGVQPTSIPEICLKEDYVDGVGMGEGEETIIEIAKAYQGEMEFSDIKGFAYKTSNHKIIVNKRRDFIEELDTVFPDYSLINLEDYIFYDGQITGLAMSSRGCPYNCSFCYNNSFNHRRWRAHSEEFIVENILELKKRYPFSKISFSDDNFMVNKKRAYSILEKLHRAGIRTYSIDLRIKGLSEGDVKELNGFEVISIFFGTESLNPSLLKLLQKEHTKEEVVEGLVNLDRYPNIIAQSEILIGLPFETKEEMIQDIREGLGLYRYHRNFSLYFGVLFPLPKTKMFEYAKGNGFNPSSIQDFAQIDLVNVWKLCDGWLPWADECIKKKLFWTERFSEIIQLNRIHRGGLIKRISGLLHLAQFHLAQFRLIYQFFAASQVDFFVYRSQFRAKSISVSIMGMIKRVLRPYLQIDHQVNYRNFGYLPSGSIRDVRGKLFGHLNLLKRLQAKDIMNALNIDPGDLLLDFGCGSGYLTVEMAKLARKTYGIDIMDDIETIQIPEKLKGCLEFIKTGGTKLPFQSNFFDKILASEVLPMIPDPTQFLSEMRRVLKPGGLLVIVNGSGHPTIKEAFEKKSLFLKMLKKIYPKRMPNSYEEYCLVLQKTFKTAQDHFLEEQDIRDLLQKCDFNVESMDYTPGYWTGAYFSWSQFALYLKTGKTLSQHGFVLKYCFFTLLKEFEKRKYHGGIICVARKGRESVESESFFPLEQDNGQHFST